MKLSDKVRFHSFRHNVADNLKQQEVSQDIIGGILRHSNSKITFSVYTKDYKPSVLKKVIDKLDCGFDIYRTLNVKPLSDEEISKQIETLFSKE